MIEQRAHNVYIAYGNVVYKLSGRDGSVIWKFALRQRSMPYNLLENYLQLSIVNDVIYVAYEHDVYALRASDGKELWRYAPHLLRMALMQDSGRIVEMYLDQSVMYLALIGGDISVLDLRDGKLKWKALNFPHSGALSMANDTLYAPSWAKYVTTLQAIDGLTGKECWHFQRELVNSSDSPTFVFDDIVYSSGNPLYALDARTGTKLWEQHLPPEAGVFTNLTIRNGVVYANTGAVVLVGGQENRLDYYRVFAFDAVSGKRLWNSQSGYKFSDVMINDSRNLLVESIGQKECHLQVLDAKTGRVKWEMALGYNDLPVCTQVIVASNRHLYTFPQEQRAVLQVFDIETGGQIEHYSLAIPREEEIDIAVLDSDTLYVRSSVRKGHKHYLGNLVQYTIYAIDLNDGKINWKYDMGSWVEYRTPMSDIVLAP